MAIYMKLGTATGAVTESGHVGWIELLDCRWDMSRTVRSAVGVGTDRESTSAYVSEVTAKKLVDSSSTTLNQNAFVGQAQACQIDFTRTDKGKEAIFRTLILTDTIISGLVTNGASSDRPTESLSLNFTEIAITDIGESDSGGNATTSTVTYNLATAQTG